MGCCFRQDSSLHPSESRHQNVQNQRDSFAKTIFHAKTGIVDVVSPSYPEQKSVSEEQAPLEKEIETMPKGINVSRQSGGNNAHL